MDKRWKDYAAVALVVLIFAIAIRIFTGGFSHVPVQPTQDPAISSEPLASPTFTVYFAARDEARLVPEFHHGEGTVAERLNALMQGPLSSDLTNVLPQGTLVLGYEIRDSIIYVDFSRELSENHSRGSAGELITVYGIVNTLLELSGVTKVQILIEGEYVESLAGHVSLLEPLASDYSLLGSYRL